MEPVHPIEKELKVMLPHRLVMKLHSVKILQGRPIRDTLVEALDAYYAREDVQAVIRTAAESEAS